MALDDLTYYVFSVPMSCDDLFEKRGLTTYNEEIYADIDPDGYMVGMFPIRVHCFKERGGFVDSRI